LFCRRNAHLLDALSRADQQQMQWRASLQRLLAAQAAVEGQIRAAAIVHAGGQGGGGGGGDGRGADGGGAASAEGGEISAQLLSRVEAMRRDLDEVRGEATATAAAIEVANADADAAYVAAHPEAGALGLGLGPGSVAEAEAEGGGGDSSKVGDGKGGAATDVSGASGGAPGEHGGGGSTTTAQSRAALRHKRQTAVAGAASHDIARVDASDIQKLSELMATVRLLTSSPSLAMTD
jgi:hypothetical protein